MIIRFSKNPFWQAWGIFRSNWLSICIFIALSSAVAVMCEVYDYHLLELSVVPVSILGGALAIFLGFRNNSAYDMWWEARKVWGGVVNISRTFAMESGSFVTEVFAKGDVSDEEIAKIQRDLSYRHLAWINALRIQLRGQDTWEDLKPFLSEEEYQLLASDRNRATMLLHRQGIALKKAHEKGFLDDFRHMQMENRIKEMYDLQGKAERIKKTIFPYYYSYFTTIFLWLFVILLPFSLVHDIHWAVIPITTMISFVFMMLNKAGTITEDPFEGRAADIPLSSLCRTIEIDVRQQLGETDLPEKMPITKLKYGLMFES
ncbi:MAG: putative membrane protein [Parvicellaceae bacterium]|jgi:putative membrane protein